MKQYFRRKLKGEEYVGSNEVAARYHMDDVALFKWIESPEAPQHVRECSLIWFKLSELLKWECGNNRKTFTRLERRRGAGLTRAALGDWTISVDVPS